jgi:hypothetical protein
MAAAISRFASGRLGLGLVDPGHELEAIEFLDRGAGFVRSTAAQEQFRQDKIRLRLARMATDGPLLDGACFGESIVPSQHYDQQIECVGFPNIDFAGALQTFNRAINLSDLAVQAAQSKQGVVMPPMELHEFLHPRQRGARSAYILQ